MATLATVIIEGAYSSIGAPGMPGRIYFAIDTRQTWYDNGTSWVNVSAAVSVTPVAVTSPAPGNFTVAHGLGRVPGAAVFCPTSGGQIWFQSPTMYDATNLYLTASDDGITSLVILF